MLAERTFFPSFYDSFSLYRSETKKVIFQFDKYTFDDAVNIYFYFRIKDAAVKHTIVLRTVGRITDDGIEYRKKEFIQTIFNSIMDHVFFEGDVALPTTPEDMATFIDALNGLAHNVMPEVIRRLGEVDGSSEET